MREDGLISPSMLRRALQNMEIYGDRMEEALLRVGALDEPRLLKFVAQKSRTHYVSTGKLARLSVPDDALSWLNEKLAERLLAFPVRFDRQSQVLTLVSPDAGNPEHVKQIAIAVGLNSLQVYVARPAAVKAAICKWYRGEIQAFSRILPDTFTQIQNAVDMYERQLLEEDGLQRHPSGSMAAQREWSAPPPSDRSERASSSPATKPAPKAAVTNQPPPKLRAPELPSLELSEPLAPPQARQSSLPAGGHGARAAPTLPPDSEGHASPGRMLVAPRVHLRTEARPTSERHLSDLAETMHVLVMLAENARDEMRGHSAAVARTSRWMLERLGLDRHAVVCAELAANLHDLGKTVTYHLTALNVAEHAAHRTAAQRLVMTPLRLLENVELPSAATSAVSGMYERYDGQGFPAKLAGKEIPLGARLLALTDSYSALTSRPGDRPERALSPAEALAKLAEHRATLFDPDLLDLLRELVQGEDLRQKLGPAQPLVLLVEPNPEEATLLELRLVAQGFDVKVARTADAALALACQNAFACVFSELDLEPFDGLELLTRLHEQNRSNPVPFVFVAKTPDTRAIDRGFALGALDYVLKPTSGDVLAAKLRRSIKPSSSRDVSSGVSGSLNQMSLPDLSQVMAHGRKTGRIRLRSGLVRGEVHFKLGRIVHATCEDRAGPDAFYELLRFAQGTFAFDPSFQPSVESITDNHETLILEGFRRIDEDRR